MDCVTSNAEEGQPLTNIGAQGYSPQSISSLPSGWRPLLSRMAPARAASRPGFSIRARCEAQPRIDKDKADEGGGTALHQASMEGHLDVVRLLLEAGADKDKAARLSAAAVAQAQAHAARFA